MTPMDSSMGEGSLLDLYNIDRRIQQQIDKLISGTVRLCGQIIQSGYHFVPHTDGNDLISIISPTV